MEARIIRSEAMKWWATLTPDDRKIYCKAFHGRERRPESLTGREIENMYVTSKD